MFRTPSTSFSNGDLSPYRVEMNENESEFATMSHDRSRREFVKKAVYVAPIILTLTVQPAFARGGSAGPERPQPPTYAPKSKILQRRGPGFINRVFNGDL